VAHTTAVSSITPPRPFQRFPSHLYKLLHQKKRRRRRRRRVILEDLKEEALQQRKLVLKKDRVSHQVHADPMMA
jgi:hypothetical protein